jgi:glycosyltransferase involved in cell wall biosynthesis
MRVVHIIPSVNRKDGGPTTALLGLASTQVMAGMAVEVLTTFRADDSNAMVQVFESRGVRMRTVGPVRGKLGQHPDLDAAVEESVARADVVHIHAVWEEILHKAAQAAQRQQVPYIVRPCGMLDPWSLKRWRIFKKGLLTWRIRKNLNQAMALHCTSDTELAGIRQLGLQTKFIVEPNGIDLAEFETLPERGVFASQYPQLIGRPFVLFFSRIHPKKGLDVLIPAFAKVAYIASLANWMLVLSGPDGNGYGAAVRRMVRHHGLKERVLFTGMLTDGQRIAALRDASLFVLPSRQENFGLAVVEALAASTPVIISDQVNIHCDITTAAAGEVVKLSEQALADALQRWMSDQQRRHEAGQRGRTFALERYDWRNIAQAWWRHYSALPQRGKFGGASISTVARSSHARHSG